MNEYAIIFMVKAQELPKEYKDIINDCKAKVIEYFGTRNVDNEADKVPGIHIVSEITKDDAEKIRNAVPNYVEISFIKKEDDKFIVSDL